MELENYSSRKNTLSIRLTESAVFLSTDVARDRDVEPKSTLLRGLLVLSLVKPTKITSIEVELMAKTSTAWQEGIGSRRIEVTEEHRVFNASILYFRATRRTASIGPGIFYNKTDDNHIDHINETPIHATTNSGDTSRSNHEINTVTRQTGDSFPTPTPPSRPLQGMNPRVSAGSSHLQRMSLDELDEGTTDLDMQQFAPIPPYSSFSSSITPDPSNFPTADGVNENPDLGQSTHLPTPGSEDSRHLLYASSRGRQSLTPSPKCERMIPEDNIIDSGLDINPGPSANSSAPRLTPAPVAGPSNRSSSSSQPPSRGRRRFNLSVSAVSNVIIDAVRSSSPRKNQLRQSREREHERSRDRSVDTIASSRRGRTMERGVGEEFINLNGADLEKDSKHVKEKGRGIISMMLGDREKEDKDKEKAAAEGWKEFKKGTYTFPISFSIPGNAPPTMACDYGSVTWRLKANVHRPGTFKFKMTAVREVIVVACPTAEDTEDTENIIVERHWDQQLQYLISISGRSFYVGGTVPVTFTLMPLAKIKIYRLTVFLEERVDYYTNMKRIARTDPIVRFTLLSIKGDDNRSPILPLQSDDPDALRHSPLFPLVDPGEDLSEVASSLMGPGPWTLHQDLKLPGSCSQMKFTNKNRKSNIIITHTLKLVMRVERGDDLIMEGKTGKRKLFDIVIQTPVLILSCRCNPDWTCLPRYSEVLDDSTAIVPSCPCRASRLYPNHTPIEAIISRQSSDSGASAAETSPVCPTSMMSLRQLNFNEAILRSSSLFERLVSGQESVSGEVPPAYDVLGSRPATNGIAML